MSISRPQQRQSSWWTQKAGLTLALSALTLAAPAVAQTTVTIDQGEYYLYQSMEFTNSPGEVAFDPTDDDQAYLVFDPNSGTGTGSIYRLDLIDDVFMLGELVVQGGASNEAFESPSGIAFDANGDLYVVEDFDGFLAKVATPRTGAPYVSSVIVDKNRFGTGTSDDDPIAITLVPAGFDGPVVDPGDMVFVDRGYNNNNNRNAVYRYRPGQEIGEFHNDLLSTFEQLAAYETTDFNDISFALDGSFLYGVTSAGKVLKIAPDGTASDLAVTGVTFGALQAIGTNPADGRLWIADDTADAVWSVDPATGEARRELAFARTGAAVPGVIDFHFPGLQFSSTGEYLTVVDQTPSPNTVFIFKRLSPGNHPPVARVATDPVEGILASDGTPVTATLDASASDDGDGGAQGLTYKWTYLGSTSGVVVDQPTSAITSVTLPTPGQAYVFRLTIDDGLDKAIVETRIAVAVQTTVEFAPGGYFKSAQSVFAGHTPGEVAFDAGDEDTIYVINDEVPETGGGIYRFDLNPNGTYSVGEQLLSIDRICSFTIAEDGTLWYVRDFGGGAATPYFGRLTTPRNGPPYTHEGLITNFVGTGDDDPFVVRRVPAGFDGATFDPGDLFIVDAGTDVNEANVIYIYSPVNPQGDLNAYSITFMDAAALTALNTTNLNDVEFSADGTRLYLAFDNGGIYAVDATGALTNTYAPFGVNFVNVEGIAVNPVDGRIWVADDNLDQLWSFDPVTGEDARREASFFLPGEVLNDFQINFHDPGLTFSPDGKRLVVTDTGRDVLGADGWIWVLSVDPPVATFPNIDGDSDVDLNDLLAFQPCVVGAGLTITDPNCLTADLDGDGDADQSDFAKMQLCFSGDGVQWTPSCLD